MEKKPCGPVRPGKTIKLEPAEFVLMTPRQSQQFDAILADALRDVSPPEASDVHARCETRGSRDARPSALYEPSTEG
jgi:hypothetical protein